MPRRRKPDNPFRWFDSSPEVIRLVVMMYVKYPLSLQKRGGSSARARHRHLPRDGAAVVEPLWADVRRRECGARGPSYMRSVHALEVASRRGLREASTASCTTSGVPSITRARCWSPSSPRTRDKAAALEVHQEGDEASRLAQGDHHRRPALVQGGHERDRQPREAARLAAGRTTGPKTAHQPSATTRAYDAADFRRMKTLQKFASVHGSAATSISIRSATSSAATSTRSDARPPWPSGGRSTYRPGSG